MFWNSLLIYIIQFIHICVMLFVVSGPLIINPISNILYLLFIPFMVAHWVFNNDSCVLTRIEMYLRGVDKSESIFFKIISPIYQINQKGSSNILYCITVALYLIVVMQVVKNYKLYHNIYNEFTFFANNKPTRDVSEEPDKLNQNYLNKTPPIPLDIKNTF